MSFESIMSVICDERFLLMDRLYDIFVDYVKNVRSYLLSTLLCMTLTYGVIFNVQIYQNFDAILT